MYMLLIIAELLVGQIGFAVTSTIDPLAAGLIMAITGAAALAIYVKKTTGRLSFRSPSPKQKIIVCRLAAGSVIVNVCSILGVHYLGLGVIATMTAIGPLCVGTKNLWARRWTRNGALHIVLRLIAISGVFVVNEAWTAFAHFDAQMMIGFICGIAGAWSFWNYNKVLFGNTVPPKETTRLFALANVLAIPASALTVWVASLAVGGGYADLSLRVLALGAVAGILGSALPVVLAAMAAKKAAEKCVPEETVENVSSMLYLLDSPIAAGVGLAGAELGLLPIVQVPDIWTWIGSAIVVIAAAFVTKLTHREERPQKSPPRP